MRQYVFDVHRVLAVVYEGDDLVFVLADVEHSKCPNVSNKDPIHRISVLIASPGNQKVGCNLAAFYNQPDGSQYVYMVVLGKNLLHAPNVIQFH